MFDIYLVFPVKGWMIFIFLDSHISEYVHLSHSSTNSGGLYYYVVTFIVKSRFCVLEIGEPSAPFSCQMLEDRMLF